MLAGLSYESLELYILAYFKNGGCAVERKDTTLGAQYLWYSIGEFIYVS